MAQLPSMSPREQAKGGVLWEPPTECSFGGCTCEPTTHISTLPGTQRFQPLLGPCHSTGPVWTAFADESLHGRLEVKELHRLL